MKVNDALIEDMVGMIALNFIVTLAILVICCSKNKRR